MSEILNKTDQLFKKLLEKGSTQSLVPDGNGGHRIGELVLVRNPEGPEAVRLIIRLANEIEKLQKAEKIRVELCETLIQKEFEHISENAELRDTLQYFVNCRNKTDTAWRSGEYTGYSLLHALDKARTLLRKLTTKEHGND